MTDVFLCGIVYVIRNGLQWKDAPQADGPHKTLYNRFFRWSRLSVFDRIFVAPTEQTGHSKRLMIDAIHLKAHRTSVSLLKKGAFPRHIGRTKGGLNSKLHAVCDDQGRPVPLHLTAGQVSDYTGAVALEEKGLKLCIPDGKSRGKPVKYDKRRYKRRNRIEIMFGRLKGWRRVATRYDRCPTVFFSAVCLAATALFWL
jgi:transposase